MKDQWTDISLQYLTLRTLCLALSENPRGQSHFKSIGGLEVLLDGLGLPSINVQLLKSGGHVDVKGYFLLNLHLMVHLCFDILCRLIACQI